MDKAHKNHLNSIFTQYHSASFKVSEDVLASIPKESDSFKQCIASLPSHLLKEAGQYKNLHQYKDLVDALKIFIVNYDYSLSVKEALEEKMDQIIVVCSQSNPTEEQLAFMLTPIKFPTAFELALDYLQEQASLYIAAAKGNAVMASNTISNGLHQGYDQSTHLFTISAQGATYAYDSFSTGIHNLFSTLDQAHALSSNANTQATKFIAKPSTTTSTPTSGAGGGHTTTSNFKAPKDISLEQCQIESAEYLLAEYTSTKEKAISLAKGLRNIRWHNSEEEEGLYIWLMQKTLQYALQHNKAMLEDIIINLNDDAAKKAFGEELTSNIYKTSGRPSKEAITDITEALKKHIAKTSQGNDWYSKLHHYNDIPTIPLATLDSAQYAIASYPVLEQEFYKFTGIELPSINHFMVSSFIAITVIKRSQSPQPMTGELIKLALYISHTLAPYIPAQDQNPLLLSAFKVSAITATTSSIFGIPIALAFGGLIAAAETFKYFVPSQDTICSTILGNSVSGITMISATKHYVENPSGDYLYMLTNIINSGSLTRPITNAICEISSSTVSMMGSSSTESDYDDNL